MKGLSATDQAHGIDPQCTLCLYPAIVADLPARLCHKRRERKPVVVSGKCIELTETDHDDHVLVLLEICKCYDEKSGEL